MSENKNMVRTKRIVALPGDGIGPEIVAPVERLRNKETWIKELQEQTL